MSFYNNYAPRDYVAMAEFMNDNEMCLCCATQAEFDALAERAIAAGWNVAEGLRTADGQPIVQGLRVWDNDLRPGIVDLTNARWENSQNDSTRALWFRVQRSADDMGTRKGDLVSPDRVATRHPFTRELA